MLWIILVQYGRLSTLINHSASLTLAPDLKPQVSVYSQHKELGSLDQYQIHCTLYCAILASCISVVSWSLTSASSYLVVSHVTALLLTKLNTVRKCDDLIDASVLVWNEVALAACPQFFLMTHQLSARDVNRSYSGFLFRSDQSQSVIL